MTIHCVLDVLWSNNSQSIQLYGLVVTRALTSQMCPSTIILIIFHALYYNIIICMYIFILCTVYTFIHRN